MANLRIAFIIQRYGSEVVGGAEALCRAIAQRLAAHWTIEVLTTCAVDHMTWANELPPGAGEIEGVTVRRFPVDRPRDVRAFNRRNERILLKFHTFEKEQEWMDLQGPHSSALQTYLAENSGRYDGFVLFNYLYATTYESFRKAGNRFYLVPFAHDEPPIYLRLFDEIFRAARGLVFCAEEENEFIGRRFPFPLPPHEVIGMGVDVPSDVDAERFRRKFNIRAPFMLYAGRIDESKGCDQLFKDFAAYLERAGQSNCRLSLVLCGSSQLSIPRCRDIHYLGFLSEQDKADAMAAARFLVLPSLFESLSIVLLESWAAGTPVLVNGRCEVSAGQCRRSGAGTSYRNTDEFCAAADWLAHDDDLRARLGRSGHEFVRRFYQWPRIIERYLNFIRFDA